MGYTKEEGGVCAWGEEGDVNIIAREKTINT